MIFKNKTIFIISYENWGLMHMSKHHYAVELGKLGNDVYFINHPDKRHELKRGEIKVIPTGFQNVSYVQHRFLHPYFLKFKLNGFYNILTDLHIRRIIKKVGKYPDVVWSFDTGNTLPLKSFTNSQLRIFMPVDGPFGHKYEMRASQKADVIISVTPEILSTFDELAVPKLQLNHGVADVFINEGTKWHANEKIRVGYSGSLVRNDLDTKTFLKIISKHPDKIFEFWGENDYLKSNIHLPQDVSKETLDFLDTLNRLPNVIMHGPVTALELARGIQAMDALLICYNIKNDQNHHKVLEYLGTGRVIISNYLSAYSKMPGLIEMVSSTDNNDDLPDLFDKVMHSLSDYNSEGNQAKRLAFAKQYTYASNVKRIEDFVNRTV